MTDGLSVGVMVIQMDGMIANSSMKLGLKNIGLGSLSLMPGLTISIVSRGSPMIDPNERIDAIWVRDSETGDWVLVDKLTNREVIRTAERPIFRPEEKDRD